MGYMLERAIINELQRRSIDKEVTTVLTQVVVDGDDPAFSRPTKPIGPFYTEFRAAQLQEGEAAGHGRGRRPRLPQVVASPKPIDIVPKSVDPHARRGRPRRHRRGRRRHPGRSSTAAGLTRASRRSSTRTYASVLLAARECKADLFIILTAVERVFVNFGKPDQAKAPVLTVDEARRHLDDGQFPPGSMGPKIEAAVEYIRPAAGRS